MAYVGVWAKPTPPHMPIHLLQGWLFQHAPRSVTKTPCFLRGMRICGGRRHVPTTAYTVNLSGQGVLYITLLGGLAGGAAPLKQPGLTPCSTARR
jgi:hypothetical protein